MTEKWREGMEPHLVVGGQRDGCVVQYFGCHDPVLGFNYSIPGVFTFAPLYLHADRLEPISIDEANRRYEEFLETLRVDREEQA